MTFTGPLKYSVDSKQFVQAAIAGPGTSNQLLIFTGIAVVDWVSDREMKSTAWIPLDITALYGQRFNPKATQMAAVAWLSSMHAEGGQVTWAVDKIEPTISDQGDLVTNIALAQIGNASALSRVTYEVFVQTTSLKVIRVSPVPNLINLGSAPVNFALTVQLEATAPSTGEFVYLSAHPSRGVKFEKNPLVFGAGQSVVTTVQNEITPSFPVGSGPIEITISAATPATTPPVSAPVTVIV